MRRRRTPARLTLLAVVLGLVLPGGVALAFWTAAGIGSGSNTTATPLALAVTAGTPTGFLHPGGVSDVAVTLSNPNLFVARVPSLQLDTTQGTGGFSVDAAHSGCAVSALSFTSQTNGGAGWTVPARVGVTNGQLVLNLGGAVAMSTGAANACQGATFTVYVKVGP